MGEQLGRAFEIGLALAERRLPFHASLLTRNGISQSYLRVACIPRGMKRLDRGVYGIPDDNPRVVIAAAVVRGSGACLFSALFLHGLLSPEPSEAWLCIGHKAWAAKQPESIHVNLLRTSVGFTEAELGWFREGIAFTSVPRTVVDFHRYRRRVPAGSAGAAFRLARDQGRCTEEDVAACADRLRVRWKP